MNLLLTVFSITLSILFSSPTAWSEETPQTPIIHSIKGSKTVTLVKKGHKRVVPEGTPMLYGERLKTGKETAEILYPDGSKVIVTANSDFKIEEPTDSIQWNRLQTGTVRGIIKKTILPASTKPKFIIRNKAAVMGVRGTDFVMAVAQNSTVQVHTLEGAVEVARNEMAVLNHTGTMVNDGQYLEASREGLTSAKPFDKAEFLKKFNSELPASQKNAASGLLENGGLQLQAQEVQTAPPPQPLPTKFPPPPPPIQNSEESKTERAPASQPQEKEKESKSGLYLFVFDAGIFYCVLPNGTHVRAANTAWAPRLVLPYLTFLEIQPSIGGNFAPNGSLNNNFLIMEYQLYVNFTLFDTFFGGVGMGEQIWKGDRTFDGGVGTIKLGIIPKMGIIDRIYIAYQIINHVPIVNEYKAGITLKF